MKIKLDLMSLLSEIGKLKRFPFAAISILFLFIIRSLKILNIDTGIDVKIEPALLIGAIFFLANSIFWEVSPTSKKSLRYLVALLIAGATAFIFPSFFEFELRNGFIYFLHWLLIALLCLSVAGARLSEGAEIAWKYWRGIYITLVGPLRYSILCFIGFLFAYGMLWLLFDLKIKNNVISLAGSICFILLAGWVYLVSVPTKEEIKLSPYAITPFIEPLVKRVIIPFTIIYLGLFYAFMAKIAIAGEWPKGYVGWLVAVVGLWGVSIEMLYQPLLAQNKYTFVTKFFSFYKFLIIPPILLLLFAVYIRVSEYGFTERRVVLALLGIGLLLRVLWKLLSPKQNILAGPLFSLFIAISTLLGPTSLYSLSLESQLARLDKIFERYAIDPTVKGTVKVEQSDEKEIKQILGYVMKTHGAAPFKRVFGENVFNSQSEGARLGFSASSSINSIQPFVAHLGLKPVATHDGGGSRDTFHIQYRLDKYPVKIAGYSHFFQVRDKDFGAIAFQGTMWTVGLESEYLLLNAKDGRKIKFNLSGVKNQLENSKKASVNSNLGTIQVFEVKSFESDSGNYILVPKFIHTRLLSNDFELMGVEGFIFYK